MSNYYQTILQYCFFLIFKNKMYNTHTYKLNNVLKITHDNATLTIDEIIYCHTHKQFHRMLLSHVTVTDPDSSDSSRLNTNERYASV